MNKFIEYQHRVPPIDPATLLAYARLRKLNAEDAVLLALLHSATYCEVTAIFLLESLDWSRMTKAKLERFWKSEKANLIFNSSRQYAKSMNWFVPIMADALERTGRDYLSWIAAGKTYDGMRETVERIPFTGHFASGRFMEALLWMSTTRVLPFRTIEEPRRLPWANSANETSGLLNILYLDEAADRFDRDGTLEASAVRELDVTYPVLHAEIFRHYPNQIKLRCAAQGKLCSWRNLFKAKRYGGYHHDRQLKNLRHYQTVYPAYDELWNQIFAIRRRLFSPILLGEVSGWEGIRKNRQRLWLDRGLTGVEEESL